MRRRGCCVAALAILFLVSGCEHDVYDLLLQPRATGMQRTLVYSRIDTDEAQNEVLKLVLQAELDRLAVLYGMPTVPAAARRFTFVREFPERTPDDVGGAGYCRCWPSSLGSLGVYVERFRGSDDQAAEVEKRLQAADRLVALLRDWLETRLGRAADWDRLQAFLADACRRDLHNLVLVAWAGHFVEDSGLAGTAAKDGWFTMARVLLFLAERGYLLPQELPAWLRACREQEQTHGNLAPLAPLIASALARRAGLAEDSAVVVALRRELMRAQLQDDVEGYLAHTPEWQARLAAWQAEHIAHPETAAPVPTDVLADLALLAAGFGPGSGGDGELRLRLRLTVEPFQANGTWDAAKRDVSWRATLVGPARTPYLAYASWSEPDEARQTQRFGRTVLRGEALGDYALWVHGLDAKEAAEWEAFLDRLRPAGDPAARLAEFRFESEMAAGPPTEENLAASHAQPGRKLLLDALKE